MEPIEKTSASSALLQTGIAGAGLHFTTKYLEGKGVGRSLSALEFSCAVAAVGAVLKASEFYKKHPNQSELSM